MPLTTVIEALPDDAELTTAGAYLAELARGAVRQADLIVLPVPAGGVVAADPALDAALGIAATEVAAAGQLTGKPGQSAQALAKADAGTVRVVFLGVGEGGPADLRRAGADLGRLLRPGESALTTVVAGQPAEHVRAFAEGILLGSYRYEQKSAAVAADPARVRLAGSERTAGSAATVVARAVGLARDLANTPALTKSPRWLAEAAAEVARQNSLGIRVRAAQELADAGFGGIVAVGSGSERPPRLIELTYSPPGARRHVVLVGKGITFDTGGLSLKPNDGMKAMKTDMAGGAAVIATLSALASLNAGCRVTGLVAAAENMPSGSAYRPGDVITQYGGRTVEVLNTDAEGRLVLADAISYAVGELGADEIVDVATLTGAVRVALGSSHAGLFSTSDALAAELIAAGSDSGERLWRLPLVAEYRSSLDSPVADLSNVSRSAGLPGSITAALFLREFVGDVPWAHLDIAGAGRSGSDDGELTPGATGFGTRLLLRWLAGSGS